MVASFLLVLSSPLFPATYVKAIVSSASVPDVLTAHEDVYGGSGVSGNQESAAKNPETIAAHEDNVDLDFVVLSTCLVRDADLLRKSLSKLAPGFVGFIKSEHVQTIRSIVERINDLAGLMTLDDSLDDIDGAVRREKSEDDEIQCTKLIVTKGSVSATPQSISGAYTTQEVANVVAYSVSSELTSFDRQAVPTTDVLALTSKGEPGFWTPTHKQFVILNKGYVYALDVMHEVFPELTIEAHVNFPCVELAENMLWYQAERALDGGVKGRASSVDEMLEKIRAFFECRCAPANGNSFSRSKLAQVASATPFCTFPASTRICELMPEDDHAAMMNSNAPAFDMQSSPCDDAFATGIDLWNRRTRKDPGHSVAGAETVIMIRAFVDTMCHRARGHKVQSSKLYQAYKDFHKHRKPEEKPLCHAQFSILMKQVSVFETHRYNSAVYWLDVVIANNASAAPQPV